MKPYEEVCKLEGNLTADGFEEYSGLENVSILCTVYHNFQCTKINFADWPVIISDWSVIILADSPIILYHLGIKEIGCDLSQYVLALLVI